MRHWDTGGSIPYSLNSSLAADWKSGIRSAMSSWAVNVSGINTFTDQGEVNHTDFASDSSHIIWRGTIPAEWQAGCPPSTTIACTNTKWYVPGMPGVYTENHIFDADMVFASSVSMGTTCWRSVFGVALGIDIETLALHELGHYIGVAHTPDKGSSMYAKYQDCDRALSVHDWESGSALYDGHGHA